MIKTYRYRYAGPPSAEFQTQCAVTPTIVRADDWTFDLSFDEACKGDVDEYLAAKGFEFVEEIQP